MELIIAVFTFATALLALISSRINSKQIQEIHISLNSRLTELLKKTEEASKLQGHADGVAQEKLNQQ